MTFKQRFCRPPVILTLSVMSLLSAVSCNLQAAQSPSISLVTDTQMDPAARHGVSKVRLALQAKGIQIEQTTSLKTTQSDLLVVLGLFSEAGPIYPASPTPCKQDSTAHRSIYISLQHVPHDQGLGWQAANEGPARICEGFAE